MLSCPRFGPLLFFFARRRGAPRGGGEEEALVQTKMDPCFYKMILCYVASMAKVWCRLDLPQHPHPLARWPGGLWRCGAGGVNLCPLLLFPLPLPWRAPHPRLPRRRPGEVPSAHTGQKGQPPGSRPAAHYFFPLHFYLLLLLGSPLEGELSPQGTEGGTIAKPQQPPGRKSSANLQPPGPPRPRTRFAKVRSKSE